MVTPAELFPPRLPRWLPTRLHDAPGHASEPLPRPFQACSVMANVRGLVKRRRPSPTVLGSPAGPVHGRFPISPPVRGGALFCEQAEAGAGHVALEGMRSSWTLRSGTPAPWSLRSLGRPAHSPSSPYGRRGMKSSPHHAAGLRKSITNARARCSARMRPSWPGGQVRCFRDPRVPAGTS